MTYFEDFLKLEKCPMNREFFFFFVHLFMWQNTLHKTIWHSLIVLSALGVTRWSELEVTSSSLAPSLPPAVGEAT